MEKNWSDEDPLLKSGSSEKFGLWVRIPLSPLAMEQRTTAFIEYENMYKLWF